MKKLLQLLRDWLNPPFVEEPEDVRREKIAWKIIGAQITNTTRS